MKLPTPNEMLKSRTCRLTLDQYGRRDRVRVAETTACVFAPPRRLFRAVAVEPLTGGRKRQLLYSNDHASSAQQVLTWCAQQ